MRIGNIEIKSQLALAPMAGVTDAAFRQICSELGAGYTVTELISSKALCYRDKKTFSLLTQFPGEHPAAATSPRAKGAYPPGVWLAVSAAARKKRIPQPSSFADCSFPNVIGPCSTACPS